MSFLSESQRLKQLLTEIVTKIVKEATKDCFRVYKAKVISAPNGSTCSVRLVGDTETLELPYSSKVASVSAGRIVWVATLYDDFRNAIVWETYNFN